jgi:tRNA(His) 5'-end guanylyltransferase
MKFDDLDRAMRVFETSHDLRVLPGVYMVARLDGRSFTRLTKEVHSFEAPFDVRFRDLMGSTVEHLMTDCGFRVTYGYTESDEMSLLFALGEKSFGRKLRKLLSVLAGEGSARFSLLLGSVATFDCRISELPKVEHVVDYFRWRSEDARRNALNAHCYWLLRKKGKNSSEATSDLEGRSVAGKHELLFRHGVNFNDLPAWHKRGIGLYWEKYDRPVQNPVTGETVLARRRRIRRGLELPMKEEYAEFLRKRIVEGDEPAMALDSDD